jgi:hypothetical protein
MRTDDELTTRWLLPCDVHDFAAMYDFQNVVYDLWFAPYRRCEKRVFLRVLYIEAIFLPRQARDKHRKS